MISSLNPIIAIVVPIDLSTLFEKTDTRLPGNGKPYLYTRLGNPTRTAFETQCASIYQTEYALACNNIQSAYYALSLLINNPQKDQICIVSREKEGVLGDIVRQVYSEGPQSFTVETVKDI